MEFCPRCQAIRVAIMINSRRKDRSPEGSMVVIATSAHHCAHCHTFLRSEETKKPLERELEEF